MSKLLDTTAQDIMNREVLTLPANATLQEAVEAFEEYKISGAPVVGADGQPIGVLSLSDIVRTEHVSGGRIDAERGQYYLANPLADWDDTEFGSKSDYSPDVLGRETVQDWMSAEVVSVAPHDKLAKLCRTMAERAIHRVLVVDKHRILGIVTSSDIVRCIAQRA